jgi:hypothetical protein
MPRNIGFESEKPYCYDWICIGRECTRGQDCNFQHATFISMPEGDRNKLMKHMADTGCAMLNPALADNPRAVALVPEELKVKLFPSSPGASTE